MDTILPMPERLIAIGDIHGDIGKLKACFTAYGLIDAQERWTGGRAVVVQLGDQVDSQMRVAGTEPSWEREPDTEVVVFMDRLDAAARASGGRVISLIGNHEIMNSMGMLEYVSQRSMEHGAMVRQIRFNPGGDMAAILSRRQAIVKIGDILFCHAGLLPHHLVLVKNDLRAINELVNKFFTGQPIDKRLFTELFLSESGLVWTRAYSNLPDDFLSACMDDVFGRVGGKTIVVGHTPVPAIINRVNQVWFIDTGFSRAFGDNTVQVLDIKR